MKKTMILLLVMLMVLSLWGCGGQSAQEETTEPQQTQEDPNVPQDYLVTITDEVGNPIPNVIVQMCSDICVAAATDGEGIARFTMLPGDYKVTLVVMPQGLTYTGETTEFTFPEGSRELTIVLKPQ